VVSGLLNKQAAAQLGISEITLQIHRGKIMKKMQAKSLASLVRMAGSLQAALDRCASGAQRTGRILVSFSVQGGRVREPQVMMDSLRDDKVSGCLARALAGAEVDGQGRGTASFAVQ